MGRPLAPPVRNSQAQTPVDNRQDRRLAGYAVVIGVREEDADPALGFRA